MRYKDFRFYRRELSWYKKIFEISIGGFLLPNISPSDAYHKNSLYSQTTSQSLIAKMASNTDRRRHDEVELACHVRL